MSTKQSILRRRGRRHQHQAIGNPGITPLQIPLSGSTQTTSTALHASYAINPQWTVNGLFGFMHIENIGSPDMGQLLRGRRVSSIIICGEI